MLESAVSDVVVGASGHSVVGEPGAGFGLYVHWPFCQAKCPYCDFNSHVFDRIDQARWAAALAADVSRVASLTSERQLTSVFFGGGTPSTMSVDTVAEILQAIEAGWAFSKDLEVSLEANPTSVDATRFAGYREAGVTRLSLGVQALNDVDLKRLGRMHNVAEARSAFEVARRNFDRVSFDLICARQDQTREAWRAELADALSMAVDHISLYQLTVEPGTAFAARHARGRLPGLPNEDLGADLYEITVEMCAGAGLDLYEVSNFARPGAACRHNLLYWSGGDYAGVGPGAHGRLTCAGRRYATEQTTAPLAWLTATEDGTHEQWTELSLNEQSTEYIMMGLRKKDGLDIDILSVIKGSIDSFLARVESLAAHGLMERHARRVRATPQGRLLLDALIAELTME